MTLSAIVAFATEMAKLGASPAVQQAIIEHLGHVHGHSQEEIDRAVLEQRDAWQPKV
jgi:hypothetical protein